MMYDILKNFPGSQNGTKTEMFYAGTTVELSDYLAEIVVGEGWARPAKTVELDNKAVITDSPRRRKAR